MEDVVRLKKQLKRTRIFAVVMLILCVMFFAYGVVQRLEAFKQELVAEKRQDIVEEILAEAKRYEAMAMQSKAEADRQRMMVEQSAALAADCNKKKK